MAAPDWGGGRSIFGAFEADAQTVANFADNFESRPSSRNLHGCSQSVSNMGFFEQSRQAKYDYLAALSVEASDDWVRCGHLRQPARLRNGTRSLSLMLGR